MMLRRSSIAKTSVGLAIATTGMPPSKPIGSTEWRTAVASGISAAAARSMLIWLRSTNSSPTSRAMAHTRSSSVAILLVKR